MAEETEAGEAIGAGSRRPDGGLGPGAGINPFFTRHARAYALSERHAHGSDRDRLVELCGGRPGLRAVDVATGTGHMAFALAAAGVVTAGVDPTPAMLSEADRLAAELGLAARVRFVDGTAEALPFPDGWADIVTCRRAAHHFTDIGVALREARRVLRSGGVLAVSDMYAPAEATAACNRIERLRDATHAAALTADGWRRAVQAADLHPFAFELSVEDMTLQEWLSPVPPDGEAAAAVRAVLAGLPGRERDALTGGRPEGWRKLRVVLAARR